MSSLIESLGQGPRKKNPDTPSKPAAEKSKPKRQPKRPKEPPKVLEPGPFHELLAALGLKAVEALAEKRGVTLDLGETKKVDEYIAATSANPEGPQPVEIASRVVAHLLRRVPGAKAVNKKFEGRDKKSGLFSDLGVLAYMVFERNEGMIFEAAEQSVTNAFKKDKVTVVDKDGDTILDLGEVSPSVVRNDHKQEG